MSLDVFNELFIDFGAPVDSRKFEQDEFKALPSSFPKDLRDYFSEYGRTKFYNGLLQTCHPEDFKGIIALVFGADKQINYKNCFAFAYTVFGELYCWVADIGLCRIKLYDGEVHCIGITQEASPEDDITGEIYVPFSLEKQDHDYSDLHGKPLFDRSTKQHGAPELGECFGFFPTLALGGLPELKFIKRTDAKAHFAFVSQTMDYNLVAMEGYGKLVVVRPIG